MAPSPASDPEAYLKPTPGDLRYILTVLAAVEDKLVINWKELAPLLNVSRPDNAQSRFRSIGQRLGWRSFGGPGPGAVASLTDGNDAMPFQSSTPRTPSKKIAGRSDGGGTGGGSGGGDKREKGGGGGRAGKHGVSISPIKKIPKKKAVMTPRASEALGRVVDGIEERGHTPTQTVEVVSASAAVHASAGISGAGVPFRTATPVGNGNESISWNDGVALDLGGGGRGGRGSGGVDAECGYTGAPAGGEEDETMVWKQEEGYDVDDDEA